MFICVTVCVHDGARTIVHCIFFSLLNHQFKYTGNCRALVLTPIKPSPKTHLPHSYIIIFTLDVWASLQKAYHIQHETKFLFFFDGRRSICGYNIIHEENLWKHKNIQRTKQKRKSICASKHNYCKQDFRLS